MAIRFIDKVPAADTTNTPDLPTAVGIAYDVADDAIAYNRNGAIVKVRDANDAGANPTVDATTIEDNAGTLSVGAVTSDHTVGASGSFEFESGDVVLTFTNGLLTAVVDNRA